MKTLFEHNSFGPLSLKNRLWRSATWERLADAKGHLTPELSALYTKLAQGGVGAIITGYTFVLEDEQPNPGMMGIYDDSFIPEYRELTAEVHRWDTPLIIQVCYGGSHTTFRPENRVIWGPSAVPNVFSGVTPSEAGPKEITILVQAFAQAARRARESGFDGIQLHAAHGYMLSQFLTPYYNRRTDEYGGPIHNRARILYEIVDAIRAVAGPDYPVLVKMHCTDEWGEQGITPSESAQVARELERRGVTGIELSGGHLAGDPATYPIKRHILDPSRESYFHNQAAVVAAAVQIPVILVGGNRSVPVMEEILNATDISHFSLSRPLLSEPDLPGKWAQGFRGRPRCLSCSKCWGTDRNMCVLDREKGKGHAAP